MTVTQTRPESPAVEPSDIEPLAVSPAQAARMIYVSKAHVYRMIEAGEIRAARLGKRILVPVSELRRILEERA